MGGDGGPESSEWATSWDRLRASSWDKVLDFHSFTCNRFLLMEESVIIFSISRIFDDGSSCLMMIMRRSVALFSKFFFCAKSRELKFCVSKLTTTFPVSNNQSCLSWRHTCCILDPWSSLIASCLILIQLDCILQHLANAECAPSLVHLLLLVSLAGSKGSVDDAHPLILLRYTRRLQVMQPELWPKARSILSRFLETFPRDIIHGQKVAYDIRRCAKCIIFENEQT